MNEERRRILDMLQEGKIKAQEAEQLLDALSKTDPGPKTGNQPKYLRVLVEDDSGEHGGKVNVRVPLNLIRAGVRLAAVLPNGVYDQVNKALKQNGVDIDVSQFKAENLDELVQHLTELSVDVEGSKGEKVRVFCE